MYRVKHLLTSSALYSLYCTLILPYLNYCCEIWGNTYKSRIRPLHIIQKRAVHIMSKGRLYVSYKTDVLPAEHFSCTDMVDFNSMVFLYKVYNNLLPANIMLYFQKVNASHYHNIRMKNYNFKIRFSRTTKKAECISIKGPKMWNDLPADIKLCN